MNAARAWLLGVAVLATSLLAFNYLSRPDLPPETDLDCRVVGFEGDLANDEIFGNGPDANNPCLLRSSDPDSADEAPVTTTTSTRGSVPSTPITLDEVGSECAEAHEVFMHYYEFLWNFGAGDWLQQEIELFVELADGLPSPRAERAERFEDGAEEWQWSADELHQLASEGPPGPRAAYRNLAEAFEAYVEVNLLSMNAALEGSEDLANESLFASLDAEIMHDSVFWSCGDS